MPFSRALSLVLQVFALTVLSVSLAAAEGSRTIKADQAVRILDAVCGASLPRFKNFEKKAQANGFEVLPFQEPNFAFPYGRLYARSVTQSVGIEVAKNDAGNLTCVVRYMSNENASGYYRRLGSVLDISTYLKTGKQPLYRNTQAKLIITEGTVYGSGQKELWVGIEVTQ